MKIGGFLKHTLTDYPGKIASIVFTKGCNFRCPYCHNPQLIENSDDELSPEIVLQYICKNKDLLDGVVITGGEPTLHRGLKTFILKVREIGLSVKLDTNGTHPEVLKDLMRDHLIDYIAMDIKSEFTVEAYSKATGIEVKSQLLDKVMQSVRLIIDSGIKHEFRTTLCKELVTAHNMKEMIASLKGCDRYYMQKLNTDKTLEEYAENFTLYTRDEIREQIEALHSDFPIGYRE